MGPSKPDSGRMVAKPEISHFSGDVRVGGDPTETRKSMRFFAFDGAGDVLI